MSSKNSISRKHLSEVKIGWKSGLANNYKRVRIKK